MILDAGFVSVYRIISDAAPGDMYAGAWKKIWEAPYGRKTVGYSRYFAAYQVNSKVDAMIRILNPEVALQVDDICELTDDVEKQTVFRIVQIQYLTDEESGELVVDLSLERQGKKYER